MQFIFIIIVQAKFSRQQQEEEGHKRVERLQHWNHDDHARLVHVVRFEVAPLHAATGDMVSIAAYCVSTYDFIQMDKSYSGPTMCNSPRPPTSGRLASSSGRCSPRGGTPSSTCPTSTSRSRASTQVGKASTPETYGYTYIHHIRLSRKPPLSTATPFHSHFRLYNDMGAIRREASVPLAGLPAHHPSTRTGSL